MAAVMTKKRMSKTAMRVAIAKDVIAQVRRKKIVPRGGSYFCCGNLDLKFGEDLRSQIADAPCRVCAKGALFIAHVRRFNEVTAAYSYDSDEVCEPLLEYFEQDQLDLMEQFFEGFDNDEFRKDKNQRAFERKNRSGTARLIAICRNIVRNKGTFKP